jgi:hypothetical protein
MECRHPSGDAALPDQFRRWAGLYRKGYRAVAFFFSIAGVATQEFLAWSSLILPRPLRGSILPASDDRFGQETALKMLQASFSAGTLFRVWLEINENCLLSAWHLFRHKNRSHPGPHASVARAKSFGNLASLIQLSGANENEY